MKYLLLLLILSFCTIAHSQSNTYTLQGSVKDSVSGTPIQNAKVYITNMTSSMIRDYKTVTDSTGSYIITGIYTGRHLVSVTADNYDTYFIEFDINENIRKDFELIRKIEN